MPALSNDPARSEVMSPNGHGPYLVRQEGYEPGSSSFKMQRFILQKDGHGGAWGGLEFILRSKMATVVAHFAWPWCEAAGF